MIVNDSHSKMNNLLIERLHPEARLISGDVKPFSMVQGLDDTYDGAVFVGYHARASMRGVMSHSMIFGVRHFTSTIRRSASWGSTPMLPVITASRSSWLPVTARRQLRRRS